VEHHPEHTPQDPDAEREAREASPRVALALLLLLAIVVIGSRLAATMAESGVAERPMCARRPDAVGLGARGGAVPDRRR
jgi:hypothetical protein